MANRFGDQEVNRFGDAVAAPPPSAPRDPRAKLGDAVANFAKNFWGEMTDAGQGMVDLFTHNPLETAKGMGAAQDMIRQKAQAALKRGDYTEATRHAINFLIPFVGTSLDAQGDQAQRGDISGALGRTVATAAQTVGPSALDAAAPAIAGASAKVGPAVKAAAKLPQKAAGATIDTLTAPGTRDVIGIFSPRLGKALDLAAKLRNSVQVATDRAAAEAAATKLAPEAAALAPEIIGANRPATLPQRGTPVRPPLAKPGVSAAPPPPVPAAAAPPAPAEAPAVPARAAAADIAQQLEASMRVETLTDYLARNKVPGSMVDSFGDKEWKLVADQAGVRPPSPENIQAIRGNLAEYEGAAGITAKTPAAAAEEFAKKRSLRNQRKGPAVATDPALPESWSGTPPPPPAGPAAPTASELRVEKLARHLASDTTLSLEDLAMLPQRPQALSLLEQLRRALDISGSITAGEIPQILDRVKALRSSAQ